jgi:translation initiation factor 2B subunit (eIF-2B alpha/beta/delta family)
VDLLVLGADAITEKYFVNKIGSYGMTVTAQQGEVPTVVVTDDTKLIPGAYYQMREHGFPPDEIWESPRKM